MALPNTLRRTARSVTDPTWPHCPVPGDRLSDSIVVASVNFREKDGLLSGDLFTVILLNPTPPFYTVAVLMHDDDEPGTYKVDWAQDHPNIVPAVNGDEFPHPDPDQLGHAIGPKAEGYTDMGGGY